MIGSSGDLNRISDEFLLVAACCLWPPSERRDRTVRDAASRPIDWDMVLRVVARQRVAGLAYHGLSSAGVEVPLAAKASLAAEAVKCARHALRLASESVRLQALFDAASIPAIFVKGTTMAMLAYDNLTVKQAWDIDVLVPPSCVRQACELLKHEAYDRIVPPSDLSDELFFSWTEFARESIFQSLSRGCHVELHWRLSDNSDQLSHISALSPSRNVTVYAQHSLRTLCDEDLFVFLCHHGSHHAWSRLKWLADIHTWVAAKPQLELESLYRAARANGVGRAAAQALLLCEKIFALPLRPGFSQELESDRATRWLVAIALNAMAGDGLSREIGDRRFGNLMIELSHFLLVTGVRQRARELRSKLIGGTDFQHFALPRPLHFLYPVLRVPSWIGRRAAHALKQVRRPVA